jgi:hypothetical protein
MPRQRQTAAVAPEAPDTNTETNTATSAPTTPAKAALTNLRELMREAEPSKQARIRAYGNRFYESDTIRNGRPVSYPYIFRRNIYPQEAKTEKQKLDHIELLLDENQDMSTQLLPVDLAKLCQDCGVKMPDHLMPDNIKAAIMSGTQPEQTENNNEQIEF